MTPTELLSAMLQAAEGVTEGEWATDGGIGLQGEKMWVYGAEQTICEVDIQLNNNGRKLAAFIAFMGTHRKDIVATLQAQQRRIEELEGMTPDEHKWKAGDMQRAKRFNR